MNQNKAIPDKDSLFLLKDYYGNKLFFITWAIILRPSYILSYIINKITMKENTKKGVSRREFLGLSALGLASLTILPVGP